MTNWGKLSAFLFEIFQKLSSFHRKLAEKKLGCYVFIVADKQPPPNWIDQSIFPLEFMLTTKFILFFVYVKILSTNNSFLVYAIAIVFRNLPKLCHFLFKSVFSFVILPLHQDPENRCVLCQHCVATQRVVAYFSFVARNIILLSLYIFEHFGKSKTKEYHCKCCSAILYTSVI